MYFLKYWFQIIFNQNNLWTAASTYTLHNLYNYLLFFITKFYEYILITKEKSKHFNIFNN